VGLTGSGAGRSGLGFAGIGFRVLEFSSCVYSEQPENFAGCAPPQFTQEGGQMVILYNWEWGVIVRTLRIYTVFHKTPTSAHTFGSGNTAGLVWGRGTSPSE
jgi:hypothetical protein